MAEMGGNSMAAAEKRTNSEMGKMGYAPPLKPKSAGMKKISMRKPKIRMSIRSK